MIVQIELQNEDEFLFIKATQILQATLNGVSYMKKAEEWRVLEQMDNKRGPNVYSTETREICKRTAAETPAKKVFETSHSLEDGNHYAWCFLIDSWLLKLFYLSSSPQVVYSQHFSSNTFFCCSEQTRLLGLWAFLNIYCISSYVFFCTLNVENVISYIECITSYQTYFFYTINKSDG